MPTNLLASTNYLELEVEDIADCWPDDLEIWSNHKCSETLIS